MSRTDFYAETRSHGSVIALSAGELPDETKDGYSSCGLLQVGPPAGPSTCCYLDDTRLAELRDNIARFLLEDPEELTVNVEIFLAHPISLDYNAMSVRPERMKFAYAMKLRLPLGTEDGQILDRLFHLFNQEHPKDYHERNFSVGDVVTLDETRSYLCRPTGWHPIPILSREETLQPFDVSRQATLFTIRMLAEHRDTEPANVTSASGLTIKERRYPKGLVAFVAHSAEQGWTFVARFGSKGQLLGTSEIDVTTNSITSKHLFGRRLRPLP